MPNCFCLYHKTDTDIYAREPVVLSVVDDRMREHFGAPPDDVKYFGEWYSVIGFKLALGQSFKEIREGYRERAREYLKDREIAMAKYCTVMIRITNWLETNYVSDAWAEIGRRQ